MYLEIPKLKINVILLNDLRLIIRHFIDKKTVLNVQVATYKKLSNKLYKQDQLLLE